LADEELRALSNARLIELYKAYSIPYSNKNISWKNLLCQVEELSITDTHHCLWLRSKEFTTHNQLKGNG
jgi:hypothetical protein